MTQLKSSEIHISSLDWSMFSEANFAFWVFARFKTPNIAGSLDAFSHLILWAWLTVLSVVLQTGHPKWSQFHLFIHGLKNGSNCELCHWLSFLIWLLHWEKQLCHCPIKDRHTKKRSLLSSSQEDNNKRRAYVHLIWVTQLKLVVSARLFSTLWLVSNVCSVFSSLELWNIFLKNDNFDRSTLA